MNLLHLFLKQWVLKKRKLTPYPLSDGFIDERELYQIAYGRLGLPYDSLYEISPRELLWINEGRYEMQREQYEMNTFSYYYAIKSGMSDKPFKNPFSAPKETSKKVSKEKYEEEVEILNSLFDD